MRKSFITSWRGGIIQTNPKTGIITITQGENTILIFQEDRDDFLNDFEDQPYIQDIPSGAGFGGGQFPLPEKPKKPVTGSVLSMDEIIKRIEFKAKAAATWPHHK